MSRTHEDKERRLTKYNDWLLDGAVFHDCEQVSENHVTLTYISTASRRKKAMMRLIVKMQQSGLSGGGQRRTDVDKTNWGSGPSSQRSLRGMPVCVMAGICAGEGMVCSYSIE